MPTSHRLFGPAELSALSAIESSPRETVNGLCTRCPLSEGVQAVCLGAEGAPGGLLVVAPSPTHIEDRMGRGFLSAAGQRVRALLRAHWSGPVALDYAIRCAPGKREIKPAHVKACRPYLAQTVAEVAPSRLLLFGSQAFRAILGRSPAPLSVSGGYSYLPGYGAPAFLLPWPGTFLHDAGRMEEWTAGMVEALTCADPPALPVQAVARWVESPEDAAEAARAIRASSWSALDYETAGDVHSADFRILCAAVTPADSQDVSWVWSRATMRNRPEVVATLRELLADRTIKWGAQNAKFETQATFKAFGIHLRVDIDTQLWRRLIRADALARLEVQAELVGMGGLKGAVAPHLDAGRKAARAWMRKVGREEEPEDRYAYGFIPSPELERYCAGDTVTTARLGVQQARIVRADAGLSRIWDAFLRDAIPAVARVERAGVLIDQDRLRVLTKVAELELADLRERLDAHVPGLNPNAPLQVAAALRDLGLDTGKSTPTGQMAVGEKELARVASAPFVADVLAYREVTKILGTYLVGLQRFIGKDGRVHPSILIDGASTGRTSCLAGDVSVRTRRGLIPMRGVQVGDEVWTHLGRWRRVTAAWMVGVRPTVRLALSNGYVLHCTTNHRVLRSDGTWGTVEEVLREREFAVDEGSRQPDQSGGALQGRGDALDDPGNRQGPGHDLPDGEGDLGGGHPAGRVSRTQGGSLFGVEDRLPQPDEGEVRGAAPQLEGRVPEHGRLPDRAAGGRAGARSQGRDGRGVGVGDAPGFLRGSPHRRNQGEQLPGQPRASHSERPPSHPLLASEGAGLVAIEAVYAGGSVEVFDLSVEGDESYTSAGVLSHNCQSPNLQNIPVRGRWGKELRALFRARDGFTLVSRDYSQVELREAAYLSGDRVMIERFQSGGDYHMATARRIAQEAWGIAPEDVTDAHRKQSKAVVFGRLYGQHAKALAANLSITVRQAEAIQRAIFGELVQLERWCQSQVAFARRHGFVHTFWDGLPARRRPIPGIRSSDEWERGRAERQAVNTPVQGSASDLLVASLVALVQMLDAEGFDAEIILPVHDQLIAEVRDSEVDDFLAAAKGQMEKWSLGDVPLISDAEIGPTWGHLVKCPGK